MHHMGGGGGFVGDIKSEKCPFYIRCGQIFYNRTSVIKRTEKKEEENNRENKNYCALPQNS